MQHHALECTPERLTHRNALELALTSFALDTPLHRHLRACSRLVRVMFSVVGVLRGLLALVSLSVTIMHLGEAP